MAAVQTKGPRHVFAPGVLHADDALPIHASAGREFPGADIKLPNVPLHRIAGRLIQDTAAASSNVKLLLSDLEDSVSAEIGKQGAFHFEDLAPGTYTLFAETKVTSPDKPGSFLHILAKQEVTLENSDLPNVELIVRQPVVVAGELLLDQAQRAELETASIQLHPHDMVLFSDYRQAKPATDGTFSFTNCEPARYRVHVSPPAGTFVDAVEYNRQPLTTAFLDFSNGVSGQLTIHLKRGTADLNGALSANTQPALVLLLPSSWRPGDWREVRRTVAKQGSFSFSNVPPGSYVVVATTWDGRPADELDGSNVLQGLLQEGQPVELHSGEQASLNVTPLTNNDVLRILQRLEF